MHVLKRMPAALSILIMSFEITAETAMGQGAPLAPPPMRHAYTTYGGLVVLFLLLAYAVVRNRIPPRVDAITRIVVGCGIGIWVVVRMTNIQGQFMSWSPPFHEYEVITLVGLLISAILLIWGIVGVTKGKTQRS